MKAVLKQLTALILCVTLITGCIPAISEESLTDPSAALSEGADLSETSDSGETASSNEASDSNESEVNEETPVYTETDYPSDSTAAPTIEPDAAAELTEATEGESIDPADLSETQEIGDIEAETTTSTDDPSETPAPEDETPETEESGIEDPAALTNAVISDIITAMNAESFTDELSKAEWLYGALLSTASHGDGNTAYDALVAGSADSEGYALAYTALLNEAGITAQAVYGDAADVWVVAGLNGSYTHIDVYADDASDVYGKNFGLTDAAMAYKHNWDRESVPACTDSSLNYYVRHEGYTVVTDAESLHKTLSEAIDNVKIYNANGLDLQETAAAFSDLEAVFKEEGCYAIAAVTLSGKTEDTPIENATSKISVTTTSVTLGVGQEKQIEYTVTPANSTVSFYTSSSSVCTVSSKGVITAIKAGSATITLAINGATAQVSVKVVAAPTAVSLVSNHFISADDALYVGVGEEIQLDYKTTPEAAKEIANVQYSIGSTSYATVTSGGVLKGVKTGNTSIKLTCYNGFNVSKYVKVIAAPSSLTMDTAVLTLGVGETAVSQAKIGNDTHGVFSISYTSKDSSVATVDSNGQITAVGIGETDITAGTYNGLTATRHIKVVAAPEKITLSGKYTTIAIGEPLQLECTLLPQGCSGVITWTSSSDSCASVSSSGLVTPKKEGSTKITVKTYNGVSCTYDITVKAAVTKAVFNIPTKTIGIGETIQTNYTLTGFSNSILYNSTVSNVATIDASGLVTGKRAGTTKLYLKAGNIVSSGITVEVKAAPTSLTASTSKANLGKGDTLTIGYTLSANSASTVKFTSSNTSVATVSDAGVITAVNLGTANITLSTYNGLTAVCAINVINAPTSISLSASSTTLGVGEKIQLNVGYVPEDSAGSGDITYTSSKSSVATVSKTGLITAKKKGKTVITAKTYNGKTAKLTITVKKAPTSVSISAPYTTIGIGEAEVITTTYPSGSAGSISKYVSSDTSVVTVDADGTFHGIGKGTATITATTYNNKKSNALTITVVAAPTSIAFDTKTFYVCVKDSRTLGYTILPSSVGAVSFTSSNTSIATVDSNTGKVTGKAQGSCKITVKTYNNKTAVCTVTVKSSPTAVSITASKTKIGVGESIQLSTAFTPQTSIASVTYSVSKKKYATIDSNGVLTGKKTGTVTVTVKTSNGLKATKKFTIVKAPSKIAFTQSSFIIGKGEAVDLTSYLKATKGSSCSYKFKSSDESICSVDAETGKLTGKAVGQVTVTATTQNKKTATCTLYVVNAPTSVKLELSEELEIGQKYELTSTVGPNETKYASFYRNYTVTSGTCVKINSSGMLEALSAGTATVRVDTYLSTVYHEVKVTVKKAPTFITFASTSYEVGIDDTLQLSPIIDDGATTTFTYTITKKGYFTISETGLLTPVSRGKTTVTVTTANGLSTKITVSIVDSNFPESIEWTNADDNPPTYMSNDSTGSYPTTWTPQVTVTPAAAKPQMAWSSSDESVLKFDKTSGAFKAVSYGTVTVTGRSERNASLVLTAKITVVNTASESRCLTVPTQFTSIAGMSSSAISSVISSNEAIMSAIKDSAYAELNMMKSAGTITSGEASSRKKIIDRAFAMLDFPWVTPSQVSYWTSQYDSSSYYTVISGTKYVGKSKDYRTNVLYFGLPYTQTWRNYNQSNIVSGGWYKSKSGGKYTLNTSAFSGRNYRGNDCSSFVSQSEWGSGNYDNTTAIAKSSKYTTLSKTTYATKMRPGDILVRSGHHVVMFLYYTNDAKTQFMIIEQGGSDDYNTNVVACRIRNATSYSSYTIRRPNL